MTRLIEDVTSLERVLIDGLEQGTVAVLQIVIVSSLMLAYSPVLTAIALVPVPLLAAGALAYTLTARSRYRLQRRAASALNALLHDNISGIRQIKAYTSERREHARFNAAGDTLRQATLIVMRAWAIYSPAMTFLASCGMLLIAGFGAYRVLHQQMDIGVWWHSSCSPASFTNRSGACTSLINSFRRDARQGNAFSKSSTTHRKPTRAPRPFR